MRGKQGKAILQRRSEDVNLQSLPLVEEMVKIKRMKTDVWGIKNEHFKSRRDICSNFQQRILTSSELENPTKPHVSYHYPTAALPTSKYFQNKFQICSNMYLQQNMQVDM